MEDVSLSVCPSHGPAASRPPMSLGRDGSASRGVVKTKRLSNLSDVVVGEKSLFSTKASRPPPGCIFFDDVDEVVSVEAELVGVLSVVGVQSFALGHVRFGFGCGFGSTSSRRRPVGRRPVSYSSI